MKFLRVFGLSILAAGVLGSPVVGSAQEGTAPTEGFSLGWPLECAVFEDCFIKNYPDLRAGTNMVTPTDYKCGKRTSPGLEGTQIVFKDHATTRNQPVLAMGGGRVMFVVDGLSDVRRYGARSRKACGNYVVVRHSSTHSTKYCHLREGTVPVKVGERVEAGAQLGQIGSSGATEHPILKVLLTTKGTPTDPFTGRDLSEPSECFAASDKQLWAEEIQYPAAGVMAASFALGAPTSTDIAFNAAQITELPPEMTTLTAWVKVYGVKKGDREVMTIKTPEGEIWHEAKRRHPIAANFWTAMASVEPSSALMPGVWQGVYTLKRGGENILSHTFEVKIN